MCDKPVRVNWFKDYHGLPWFTMYVLIDLRITMVYPASSFVLLIKTGNKGIQVKSTSLFSQLHVQHENIEVNDKDNAM